MPRLIPQDEPIARTLAVFMRRGRWIGDVIETMFNLYDFSEEQDSFRMLEPLSDLTWGWWAWKYGDWWEALRYLKPPARYFAETHAWLASLYARDLDMPMEAAKHARTALKAHVERSPWAGFLPSREALTELLERPEQRVEEIASSFGLSSSRAQKWWKILESAKAALLQGQWRRCYRLATPLVEQVPRAWQARRLRALSAYLMGRTQEALEEIEQALQEHPENPWLLADKTLFLAHLFQEQAALEAARELERYVDADLPDILIQHVVAALTVARHDEALNRLAARLVRNRGVRRHRLPFWTWLWLAFGVLNSGRVTIARRIAQGLNARGEPEGESLRELLHNPQELEAYKAQRLYPVSPEGRFQFMPQPYSLPYLQLVLPQLLNEVFSAFERGGVLSALDGEALQSIVGKLQKRLEAQPYWGFLLWHMGLDLRLASLPLGESPVAILMGNMLGALALLLSRPDRTSALKELVESTYGDLIQRLGWAWALWASGSLESEQALRLYHETFQTWVQVTERPLSFPCAAEILAQVHTILEKSHRARSPRHIRNLVQKVQALYETYPQCTFLQEVGAQLLLRLEDSSAREKATEVLYNLFQEGRLSSLGYRLLLFLAYENEDVDEYLDLYESMVRTFNSLMWLELASVELGALEMQLREEAVGSLMWLLADTDLDDGDDAPFFDFDFDSNNGRSA